MDKAIVVTEQNKTLNKKYLGGRAIGSIVVFNAVNFPKRWSTENWTKEAFNKATSFHEEAGFYDVVVPSIDSSIEKLSDIYFSVDHFTYDVVPKTSEELQSDQLLIATSNKELLIQAKLEEDVVSQAQELDDTGSLDNQALFPLWVEGKDYSIDEKCQDFNADDELKLYRCVQAHTSQRDWRPKDVPALFTLVAYPGEIPVWVQPTGAQDSYNIGDQVHYPTIDDPVYESVIDANVWSPDEFPAGWVQLK